MKRLLASFGILVLATGAVLAGQAAPATPEERWLHVRVEDGKAGEEGETVRVNVPLTLAEKVLPAIQVDRFQNGRVRLEHDEMKDVDLKAILQAVRETRDGEFVTVEGKDNVRVAKEKGHLLVKVREGNGTGAKVDIQVPMAVVEALLSGEKNELDVAAAVRALAKHGEEFLVTVTDEETRVRIWIDSQNTSK